MLFHVHTGPETQPQGPYQLYEDVPDVGSNVVHLRNGYYPIFAILFDSMQAYAAGLRQLNFTWPEQSVEDRISYYTIMVETVAKTLEAAGRVQSVGEPVSAFAFNRVGIQVDHRLPPSQQADDFCKDRGDMASFGEQFWTAI